MVPVVDDDLPARSRSRATNLGYVSRFRRRVAETKWKLLEFLIEARRNGKHIAGYGAPGKGNTLLNYCGIREDLIDYTVDRNPYEARSLLGGLANSRPCPREDRSHQARLRVDPAVEPEGRDHAPTGVHPRVGREVRGSDS